MIKKVSMGHSGQRKGMGQHWTTTGKVWRDGYEKIINFGSDYNAPNLF